MSSTIVQAIEQKHAAPTELSGVFWPMLYKHLVPTGLGYESSSTILVLPN
jgi:hypothetical protein